MSRILSWVIPALLIAGGWYAYKEGGPIAKRWRVQRIAEEVCKDTHVRVTRGLEYGRASEIVKSELHDRLLHRADIRLSEYDYEVEIYQGVCKIVIRLPQGGGTVKARAPFPE